ncbi:hypothetical protein [Amycolatopsis speibonae]|uniref:WXG100 family type VII secretion target n=1 Tax=Amycolatopsis speibonae TaxID=1450224 RepID=A0ABV7P3T7_9PSEU
MSQTTHLDNEVILAQASAHDTTRENIDKQLNDLRAFIQTTLEASSSAATKALKTTCDNWVESLRKSAMSHLESMAQNMRVEAGKGEATDSENMQRILSIPMETGNFLGAS